MRFIPIGRLGSYDALVITYLDAVASRSGFSCAIALLFLNAVFPDLGRHTVLAHVGWSVNN